MTDEQKQVTEKQQKPRRREVPIGTGDVDGIPYCKKHHCRMRATSGASDQRRTAYYACPVKGCDEQAKVIKSKDERIVPKSPQLCPRCKSRGQDVVCERDANVSTAMYTVLRCPECGWKSTSFARPEMVLVERRRRNQTEPEGLGSR